ncbi:MAG: DUF6431 domain-containing protein [Solirubrobacteraceae bacterium]
MLMVGVVVAEVESELCVGLLSCPLCSGVLAPWGFARERSIRLGGDATVSLRPRRSKCRACARTHVLLPDLCLLRRQYDAAVIGAAIEARARGVGYRRIAVALGVPVRTVRRWLARFGRNAEAIRAHFTRWAFALDAELLPIGPAGGLFVDAVEAIGVAARAWVLRLGRDRAVWRLVAFLSGGLLLATRGDLFPAVP